MFAYNPTVNDNRDQYIMAAAQTNQQAMGQLGQDIGGALQSIGGIYGGIQEKNAMGDSAYEALGAIGEMYPGMKSAFTALGKMDPRTRRLASMSILDNLGAISQLGIAGMNAGVRRQQMGVQTAMPGIRAAATGAQNQAAQGGPTQMSLPSRVNPDVIP